MKQLFALLLMGCILPLTVNAQTDYEPAHEGWHTVLDEAYQESAQTDKPILALFTGSDWCRPCMRMSKAVFDQPEFKGWAENNVVLLELDFPRRKSVPEEIQQQNGNLQQALQVRGYPTVVVFNLEPNPESGQMEISPLGRTNFSGSLEQFAETVEGMLQ